MRKAFLLAGVCTVASLVVSACMSRPVVSTEPQTSNLYVEPIHNEVIDKIDLLFMIDNSQSMGDKQALLAKAVPQLVNRLVVPRCVNSAGEVRARASQAEACPAGFAPEFRAVNDIHIAVITSSLGAHGAPNAVCGDSPPQNDRAQLLAKVRTTPPLQSYAGTGFLAWDPEQKLMPAGEKDAAHLGEQFGDMVKAAGESGCGFEASLESWYRFLIDPEPPASISLGEDGRSLAGPPDQELLAQRKAFLRPDSLVAIVMLTDENDCSIRDDEFGNLLASSKGHPTRATSACEAVPNDRCCLPCEVPAPQGCTPHADDPACSAGPRLTDEKEDPLNQRCLQNKRRYGYDFLYPISRYIDGLTQMTVRRRSDQQLVENPLFASAPGVPRRSKGLVYLAGIVGVPWQDIADPASLTGEGLRYLNAKELEANGRWAAILGDPSKNIAPADPFMLEQTKPRSGKNPITGDAIVDETSLNPQANAINGHEQKDLDGTDLQYACTFKLAQSTPCAGEKTCDCHPEVDKAGNSEVARNRSLCQPPGGGAAEATQYFGKAYPGLRPLEVLKGIGESAIVASICPKVLTEGQVGYGYEPAVDAIVDRLKTALAGRCLPRPLAVEAGEGGKLPCVVVEAAESSGTCSCNTTSRQPASPEAQSLVMKQLKERGNCGTSTTPSCAASSFCLCELAQSEGAALDACLNSEAGSDVPGYCYVDPYGKSPQGNKALVANCDASSRQLIRFVGQNTPKPGATTFIACLGATLD
ncbi:MAG TPA: hypothetical protein VHP33_22490 [Polyangiaceae bacterium]|nr:hypothetical protein [Polyangiaceae bacterium]